MNTNSTIEEISFPGKLQASLKSDKKKYAISKIVTVVFLLVFAGIDILYSLYNHLISNVIILSAIICLQVPAILVLHNKKNKYFSPPNIFFITTVALIGMALLNSFPEGTVFYYFPAAMIYFAGTPVTNNKKRFRHFIIITLLFAIALIINFINLPHQNIPVYANQLMGYRFVTSIIMSAILVNNLFALKTYIENSDDRLVYHQALFQSYLDAYIVFNQETKEIIDYNKRMLHLFELPAGTELKNLYINQIMMRYLAEDSANKELMMDDIPDSWHGEAGFITHSKKKFYGYVKSVVYYKEENKYQILSIRDITHTKDAEKELQVYKESLEKASRAKARFLSSMSHELRTPLNGIIGTSNLIKSEANLPDGIQKHIDVLLYSSEHMLGIINDILDFSKIDAGKLELKKQSFSLKKCIENLTGSFETQFKNKQLQLIIEHSPQLENVNLLSDEIKLSQVLSNLLSNALKFTLQGNVTLGIKIKNATEDQITIQFEVKDTGIGIPKEKQLEIFQGFAQVHAAELSRRFGGTGLGLTISEKLVAIFGGTLEVESELEKGSRFYFTLPFAIAKKEKTAIESNNESKNDTDIRGIKILVVEDNEINATILKSFLKKWEIQVKEAGNGVHALEILKYHHFDLILMDLEMPEMDGYTAIKIIRQTDSDTPVLAFTASLLEDMDTILAEAGFNGYILKPYRPAELKAKIEQYAPHRKIEYA